MKKYLALVLVVLMVGVAFAQTPREPQQEDTGATVVTNLVATGLDITGVPGYVGLRSAGSNQRTFYLYVNNNGELFIASAPQVAASGTIVNWIGAGTKVGAQ